MPFRLCRMLPSARMACPADHSSQRSPPGARSPRRRRGPGQNNDLKEEPMPAPTAAPCGRRPRHRHHLGLAGAAQAYVLSAFDASDPPPPTPPPSTPRWASPPSPRSRISKTPRWFAGLTSSLAIDGRDLPNHAWDGITTTVSGLPRCSHQPAGHPPVRDRHLRQRRRRPDDLHQQPPRPLICPRWPAIRGDSSRPRHLRDRPRRSGRRDITRIAIDGSLTPMFDHLVLSTDSGLAGSIPEPGSAPGLAGLGALARLRRHPRPGSPGPGIGPQLPPAAGNRFHPARRHPHAASPGAEDLLPRPFRAKPARRCLKAQETPEFVKQSFHRRFLMF